LGGPWRRRRSAFDAFHEVTLHLTVYALPVMLSVIEQIECLITQAVVPGADGAALLKQEQDLVNN